MKRPTKDNVGTYRGSHADPFFFRFYDFRHQLGWQGFACALCLIFSLLLWDKAAQAAAPLPAQIWWSGKGSIETKVRYPSPEIACESWEPTAGYNPDGTRYSNFPASWYPIDVRYILDVNGTHNCMWYKADGTWLSGYKNGTWPYSEVRCADGTLPDTTKPFEKQCADFLPKMNGRPACNIGTQNPIHAGTGNKYIEDTDYLVTGPRGIGFARYYNSQNAQSMVALGAAWRHSYDRFITVNGTGPVMVERPDGTAFAFVNNNGSYTSQHADITDRLTRLSDADGNTIGWTYFTASDNLLETFNADGKLVSMVDRFGVTQTLSRSDSATPISIAPKAGLLIRVVDSFGRQLNFTYDSAGRIRTMMDAAGAQYLYSYDGNNNLASVTYPDGKVKSYHYNEPAYIGTTSLPHAMTGITDENGIRYATYYYNDQGKAIAEEHAGGVNKYQLAYNALNTRITDPLGAARTTNFIYILGVIKPTGQSQPAGAGCAAAASSINYDENGNIESRIDFNGIKTAYTYDLTRNLETSKLEAVGKPQARTISTEWHPTYRLPTKIAEPKRVTTNTYDDKGNLLSKTVQATSDATGAQGFSAAAVGAARIWRYTYNQYGQVLTATGPRTEVDDTTRYAYDEQGNLSTITNAAGQVTTLSQYDAHGRVGKITDPNGLVTELAYSPRGWLTAKTVGGEVTNYEYDGVGQLKKVTQPDGAYVAYTYDDAHRLTTIADSLGNRIAYTLDAMGNRIREEVQDPNGVLSRQTTRVYDALNRLQQITGGGR